MGLYKEVLLLSLSFTHSPPYFVFVSLTDNFRPSHNDIMYLHLHTIAFPTILLLVCSRLCIVSCFQSSVFHLGVSTQLTFTSRHHRSSSSSTDSCTALCMGRAAAVRAATKAKTDAKKAKTNAIFGKKIIIAVKAGGPDPDANRQLGELIRLAKANSVPLDNVNRAIKRATETASATFTESTFEAYGFGGASLIINVLTDNNNRASADVKACVGKRQAKMAESGSVLFMYDKKGIITVPSASPIDEEKLLDAAIEQGVENDFSIESGEEENTWDVYTDPKETGAMMEALKSLGYEADKLKMALRHISKAPVEVSDAEFDKNMAIIDALEELDDVDSVEHNMSN